MSWLSKTQMVQGMMSVKRPLDFIPHGSLSVFDPSMYGTTRFCQKYEGEYVTLKSSDLSTVSRYINIGDTQLLLDGKVNVLVNGILSLDSRELVRCTSIEYRRNTLDPNKFVTLLGLELPVQRSYQANTSLFLVGFQLQLIGTYQSGSGFIMFETTEICVSGDYFATYHYESNIPVLDAWQRIKTVLDKTEYLVDGIVTRRYYCELQFPLTYDLGVDSLVYMKALPAYESHVFPVDLVGSYHVDAFTGKVFGKGSDDLTLTVNTFDVSRQLIKTQVFAKNDVLRVSHHNAPDFVTWCVGHGSVSVTGQFTCSFNLDADGVFGIGETFIKQPVGFCMALTLPSTTTSTLYDTAMQPLANSYLVKAHTLHGTTTYMYNTLSNVLEVVYPDASTASVGTGNTLYLNVADASTDYVFVEISGPVGVTVDVQVFDVGEIDFSYSNIPVQDTHVPVKYLSYAYRADINVLDTWEGSCLLLKPTHYTLDDLYTVIDELVLDSGQVFQ